MCHVIKTLKMSLNTITYILTEDKWTHTHTHTHTHTINIIAFNVIT